MTQLSPRAQTVLDAWNNEWSKGSLCHDQRSIAAALRAAADQVVPGAPDMDDKLMVIRYRLCSIADELAAQ
jgi:hypothetical protein